MIKDIPNIQSFQDHLMKYGFAPATHSDTKQYFTLQSGTQKYLVTEQCSTRFFNFCFVLCVFCVYLEKKFELQRIFPKISY